jgi:hypothetical protein
MFEYYGLVAGREGHHSFSFEIGHTPAIRRLFEQLWRPLGVCLAFGHSWCDKRVIVEPANLIHNVAPKRADIGRLTLNNAAYSADCRCNRWPYRVNGFARRTDGERVRNRCDFHEGEPTISAGAAGCRRNVRAVPKLVPIDPRARDEATEPFVRRLSNPTWKSPGTRLPDRSCLCRSLFRYRTLVRSSAASQPLTR